MKNILSAALATAVVAAAGAAGAQQSGTVSFNGLILGSCALTLGGAGKLVASTDGQTLSSSLPGGLAGTATVLTTGLGYDLEVIAPTSFASAPSDGQPDDIQLSYEVSGATVLGGVTQPLLGLSLGLTSVSIDLEGTKDDGPFPEGSYTADVTVRCS